MEIDIFTLFPGAFGWFEQQRHVANALASGHRVGYINYRDHTPLNAIGIPTVDMIDFDFAWWHTADDTIDKLSAQSLQIVGSVAAYYLSEFALKQGADFAAAPQSSLAFMFWGEGLFVFPLLLLYTAISYTVFRGKVRPTADHY